MPPRFPASHLLSEEDLPLMQVSYTFALASVWLERGMGQHQATFDVVVRSLPPHRNFLVAGGLEEILLWLQRLRFTDRHIKYLRDHRLVTPKGARYLERFRFRGTVHAMPEGTVFFGQEPILRVTAPLPDAALVEMYMMSALMSNTLFFSKAVRLVIAADGKFRVATGALRAHSFESSFKASRAAVLCGIGSPATPSFNMKYGMTVDRFWINTQHLFVTSFPDELSAFRALASMYPDNCGLLIDTYEPYRGIEHAVTVAKELKAKGHRLASIYIDSGDRHKLVAYARKRFRQEGLKRTSITVAGGMNEHRIADFARSGLSCDTVGSIEELMTVNDSPKLDVVYKLAELRRGKDILPTAKLTPGKMSYPGRKQVFRTYAHGMMSHDVIGLEHERLGDPLLQKVMVNGRISRPLPDWDHISAYIQRQLRSLPTPLRDLRRFRRYPVSFSPKVRALLAKVRARSRSMS